MFFSICADPPRDKMQRSIIQHGFTSRSQRAGWKKDRNGQPKQGLPRAHKEKNGYGEVQMMSNCAKGPCVFPEEFRFPAFHSLFV